MHVFPFNCILVVSSLKEKVLSKCSLAIHFCNHKLLYFSSNGNMELDDLYNIPVKCLLFVLLSCCSIYVIILYIGTCINKKILLRFC